MSGYVISHILLRLLFKRENKFIMKYKLFETLRYTKYLSVLGFGLSNFYLARWYINKIKEVNIHDYL